MLLGILKKMVLKELQGELGDKMKKYILQCENGHYYINSSRCPICDGETVAQIDYVEGDCIECDQLCPSYAYCCSSQIPINQDAFNNPNNK